MRLSILRDDGQYRLISDGEGRYAVIEARAGQVYSLHGRQRREAADSAEGMAAVVGTDGWRDKVTAERRFREMRRREEKYGRIVW